MDKILNFEIKDIIKETGDTFSFILREKDNKEYVFQPGRFLTFIFNIDDEKVRRGYSISSTPLDLPNLRITIKKVKDGFASYKLLSRMKKLNKVTVLHVWGILQATTL